VETEYGIDTGGAALHAIRARAPGTTAVLCGNDVLAVGALRAARQAGLRVPGDMSITGFDDIDLAMLADPPLTTVHVPHREMGRRAARALVEAIDRRAPPVAGRLQTDIRLRGSLGDDLTDEQRQKLKEERERHEATARLRAEDFQLAYALDLLNGLAIYGRGGR